MLHFKRKKDPVKNRLHFMMFQLLRKGSSKQYFRLGLKGLSDSDVLQLS